MMSPFTLITSLAIAASSVLAAPAAAPPNELIVWNPEITSPTLAQVWTTGDKYNVTWDTSDIPAEKQNATGLLLLGRMEEGNENLNITDPLANEFPLADGTVEISVPDVDSGTNYIVVLFGDSGNASPTFSIV